MVQGVPKQQHYRKKDITMNKMNINVLQSPALWRNIFTVLSELESIYCQTQKQHFLNLSYLLLS